MQLAKWAREGESREEFEDRVAARSRMSVAEVSSLCLRLGITLEHSSFDAAKGELWTLRSQCCIPSPRYPGCTGTLVSAPMVQADLPGLEGTSFRVCLPVLHGSMCDPAVVFHELGHWVLARHNRHPKVQPAMIPETLVQSIQEAYACALAVALADTAARLSWCRPNLFRRVLNVHRSTAYVTDRDIRDLLKNFLYQHLDDLLADGPAYPVDASLPADRCLRFLDYLVADISKLLVLNNMATPPTPTRTALDVWMGDTRGWPGVDPATGAVTDLAASLAELAKNIDDMPQLQLLGVVLEWLRLPKPWRRGFVWKHPPVVEFLETWVYDFGFYGLVEDARLMVRAHGAEELVATLDELVDHVAVFRHFH